MPTTLPADFAFSPKVWQDHVEAYFDKKLAFGALALKVKRLVMDKGTTINFPYFKAIGAVEEPAVDEALSVDKLEDDSFNATVKEVGKAVGVRRGSYYASAADRARIDAEIQRQIGRVHAEKVEADLISEINTEGNYVQGYTGTAAAHQLNIRSVLDAKIVGFGDKQEDAAAIFMHSLCFATMMKDSTAGFLKADANDPLFRVAGFAGRLLGMAVIVTDQCPQGTDIDSKKAYESFIVKPNAYGIITKQEMLMESDYDMLNREMVFAGTQWYAVKAFHGKVHADDKKIIRMSTPTEIAA
jgi:hypothetical protein